MDYEAPLYILKLEDAELIDLGMKAQRKGYKGLILQDAPDGGLKIQFLVSRTGIIDDRKGIVGLKRKDK